MLSRLSSFASRSKSIIPSASIGAVRNLNLHEYQSKDLLERFGVRVQKGKMAENPSDALKISQWIKKENPKAELILKAQIHAGGRGKGHFSNGFKGGVKICTEPSEVEGFTGKMLGANLITAQTGPEGQTCKKVLINEGLSIHKEMYFAIIMDREHGGPTMVGSKYGGMDIEKVAHDTPDEIHVEPISIVNGIKPEQTERLAKKIGLTDPLLIKEASQQMQNLYKLMIATDATQVEINPLAVGSVPGGVSNKIFCVDAKLNFDDNASFRQKDIFNLRDTSMEDARDVEAADAGLNFIGLEGNIGCLVNGAGLAMATMDIIKLKGGQPANFLDVGGGATAQQVTEALKIITSDKQVKAILVNIFGGIMKCDTIAEGIITGAKNVNLKIPLIVRLEGTNVDKGKALLKKSDIKIITADNLDDAAIKAVASV